MSESGLPTIQGVIVLCDGENGRLLAVIDSIEITIIRTGAATAIAAKYLARANAKTATICGCGNQGRISLKAITKVRHLETVYAFDIDKLKPENFRDEFADNLRVTAIGLNDLKTALKESDICVTCTPSKQPFVMADDIRPGTFIAAVGADSEDKQELESNLVAASKVVVDLLDQCEKIGELHHALRRGVLHSSDVHAEIGQIICGQKPGRTSDNETIVFDSTGTALQDVAAAAIVYQKAEKENSARILQYAD